MSNTFKSAELIWERKNCKVYWVYLRFHLLDFFAEFVYDDIFVVWETIWAAKYISSANFVLFIALAMVEYYREIILDNNMDFTDIIKFFNGILNTFSISYTPANEFCEWVYRSQSASRPFVVQRLFGLIHTYTSLWI